MVFELVPFDPIFMIFEFSKNVSKYKKIKLVKVKFERRTNLILFFPEIFISKLVLKMNFRV